MGHLQQAEELSKALIKNYPSSRQASLVLKDELNLSEFEKLKEQYRQAQIKQITETDATHIVSEPKIKITRKKAPNNTREKMTKKEVLTASASNTISSSTPSEFTSSSPESAIVSKSDKSVEPEAVIRPSIAQNEDDNNISANDDVKVISFGEANDKSESKEGIVKFYKTDPTEVVFSAPSTFNAVTFNDQASYDTLDLAQERAILLNREVSVPNVPFHIVKLAENLFSLSVRYEVKMAKLLVWNNLKASDKVSAGQKIFLNDPRVTYNIQPGDTLLNIATQHGLQIDDLMRWNKLTPDVTLIQGRSLLIVDPNSYVL
jgi:type IV pilus assembly protein PilF